MVLNKVISTGSYANGSPSGTNVAAIAASVTVIFVIAAIVLSILLVWNLIHWKCATQDSYRGFRRSRSSRGTRGSRGSRGSRGI